MRTSVTGIARRLRGSARRLVLSLPMDIRRSLLYLQVHHRLPRRSHPEKFSERVNHRILHDRSADLSWTCDKLKMKQEAARRCPGIRVPETYWSGRDVNDLSRVELPQRWIAKPNHRSGEVLIGSGRPVISQVDALARGWMSDHQGSAFGEWAYSQADRAILVEEWIGDDAGNSPSDYKFFVFHGRTAAVQVDSDRHGTHKRRFYTPDWVPLDVVHRYRLADVQEPPARLADMLAVAEKLAVGFDFIRIDLYVVGDTIWFGEFTPYPESGFGSFRPGWLDDYLGARWGAEHQP